MNKIIIPIVLIIIVGGVIAALTLFQDEDYLPDQQIEEEYDEEQIQQIFGDCNIGEEVEIESGILTLKYQIEGEEQHYIGNENVALCCGRGVAIYAIEGENEVNAKACAKYDDEKEYGIFWVENEAGELIKATEMVLLKEGELHCQRMFDIEGNLLFETDECAQIL